MGMVIKTNMDSVRTYNIYNKNSIQLSNSMYRASSGQRINTAADGPSDLAISERMRGRISSNEQANRNVQTGTNMLKTAEGALSNIVSVMNTIRERAMNAANDTNTSTERAYIAEEINQLTKQIDENANVTYNTQKLLNGTWESTGFNIQFGDNSDLAIQVTITDISTSGLLAGLTGLSFDTSDAAVNAIATIDELINSVLSVQTNLGSIESRLGFTADNLATENENMQASESTIRNVDFAKEMTTFMKYNVLTQTSQFMLAQAGQNPYSVMNLLGQQG